MRSCLARKRLGKKKKNHQRIAGCARGDGPEEQTGPKTQTLTESHRICRSLSSPGKQCIFEVQKVDFRAEWPLQPVECFFYLHCGRECDWEALSCIQKQVRVLNRLALNRLLGNSTARLWCFCVENAFKNCKRQT